MSEPRVVFDGKSPRPSWAGLEFFTYRCESCAELATHIFPSPPDDPTVEVAPSEYDGRPLCAECERIVWAILDDNSWRPPGYRREDVGN